MYFKDMDFALRNVEFVLSIWYLNLLLTYSKILCTLYFIMKCLMIGTSRRTRTKRRKRKNRTTRNIRNQRRAWCARTKGSPGKKNHFYPELFLIFPSKMVFLFSELGLISFISKSGDCWTPRSTRATGIHRHEGKEQFYPDQNSFYNSRKAEF